MSEDQNQKTVFEFDPATPYVLSEPLETDKGKVTQITLKLPQARLMIEAGPMVREVYKGLHPNRTSEEGFNYEAAAKYISNMSGITLNYIKDLNAHDFEQLCYLALYRIKMRPKTLAS